MLRIRKNRDETYYIEEEHGSRIAEFATLSDAAIVLRYLKGSNLTKDEAEEARAVMFSYDVRGRKNGEAAT